MLTYSWHKHITEIMDSILYAIENFQNRLLQTNNGQFYPIFIKFAASCQKRSEDMVYCTYQSSPEISTTAGQRSDQGAGLWGQGLLQTG